MLYYNNKPVNPTRRHSHIQRYFQWQTFSADTQELREKIETDFEPVKSETRNEKYFLIPGRRNVMPRMIDNTRFEVRSLVNDNEPLELWERSISTNFPLKRTTSATIGSAIPRFRGSLNSVMTPDSLSESLQRKSKYFETTKSRQVFKKDNIKAEISEIDVEGQTQFSIVLQSKDKEAILELIAAYGLKPVDNKNIADHLMTA